MPAENMELDLTCKLLCYKNCISAQNVYLMISYSEGAASYIASDHKSLLLFNSVHKSGLKGLNLFDLCSDICSATKS